MLYRQRQTENLNGAKRSFAHSQIKQMKNFARSIVLLSALCFPALAQNKDAPQQNNARANYAPVPGAGLLVFVVIGMGYGAYWVIKRRRRKR